MVIDDYRNLWFVGLLRGMESALAPHGYQVTVARLAARREPHPEATDGLLSTHLDGPRHRRRTQRGHAGRHLGPTVVAGWRNGVPAGADLVANDDEAAAGMAAEHLLGLGHTRIGHLSGSGGAAAHRREGFRSRMLEAGVEVRIAGESGGTSEEDGYAAACWILDHHPDTTALFAANDTMALGAFAAAKARGLSVPADISVIGYDNSPLAKSRYLDITSVDNRSDIVGADAARTLLARIQDPALEPGRKLIEPALVVRGTTARVSG